MKIVIIEDEKLTANDLKAVILDVLPTAEIVEMLYSVQQAVRYFSDGPRPDLIFSDIQLGDGLSFDIFDKVDIQAPIVFCTAYDEYALNAFKLKGIDYVLKPFTTEAIKASIDKYSSFSQVFTSDDHGLDEIQRLLKDMRPTKSSNILVNHKEKIIPIKMEDVAVFFIQHQATHLLSFSGKTYFLNKTLDQIEQITGENFFRANRQFLINRDAIKDASHHLSRKFSVNLKIPFEESITISKEKLSDFLNWLAS